jgi:hypothetical protein
MDDKQNREHFDTGLGKIRHEIKGRLVAHGFFGNITYTDVQPADEPLSGSKIEIAVKGKTVGRTFSRLDIESCRLRVGGPVLSGIIAMIDELSTGRAQDAKG